MLPSLDWSQLALKNKPKPLSNYSTQQLHTHLCKFKNSKSATMIKTLSPYSDAAKTAQIMSKYRPIAPKPEVPINESPSMSQKIRQSPYLRNLWPQLQARPTRTKKRGRAAVSPPTIKRQKTQMFSLSSPSFLTSPAKNSTLQVFAHGLTQLTVTNPVVAGGSLDSPVTATTPSSLMALPLLPCPDVVPVVTNQGTAIEDNCMEPSTRERDIDLNTVAEIPEEKDLLQQLQGKPVVITPQPVRPAIITDSNNKVRVANSAYKEMVGQPECPWLDLMEPVPGDGHLGGHSCRRICGEVMLHLSNTRVPFHLEVSHPQQRSLPLREYYSCLNIYCCRYT